METKQAISALAAMAQESRLSVFRLLVQAGAAGLSASKISESLAIPASSLSFHLKELSYADLVHSRQEGRFIFYSANYDTVNSLLGFLTENCCSGEACLSTACAETKCKEIKCDK